MAQPTISVKIHPPPVAGERSFDFFMHPLVYDSWMLGVVLDDSLIL